MLSCLFLVFPIFLYYSINSLVNSHLPLFEFYLLFFLNSALPVSTNSFITSPLCLQLAYHAGNISTLKILQGPYLCLNSNLSQSSNNLHTEAVSYFVTLAIFTVMSPICKYRGPVLLHRLVNVSSVLCTLSLCFL